MVELTVTARSPVGSLVYLETFGCQMNKYDSLLVEGRFAKEGYATTESMDDADVVLFNTCSVREHAEERTWSWLGELKRAKQTRPDLVIGVMGCMAQRVEEEVFRRAGHVDIVVGTRRFQETPVHRRNAHRDGYPLFSNCVEDRARFEARQDTYLGCRYQRAVERQHQFAHYSLMIAMPFGDPVLLRSINPDVGFACTIRLEVGKTNL